MTTPVTVTVPPLLMAFLVTSSERAAIDSAMKLLDCDRATARELVRAARAQARP